MVGITVDEAMSSELITAKPKDKVIDIAKKMMKNDIGSMIISKKDKLLGLITSEDLIKRVIIEKKDPKKTKAKEIMTKDLLTAAPTDDLEDAVDNMIGNSVKRLPVVEDERIVGILTDGDIMRISPELIDSFVNREPNEEGMIGDVCEICGNYSSNLRNINGRWICEECYETSPEL